MLSLLICPNNIYKTCHLLYNPLKRMSAIRKIAGRKVIVMAVTIKQIAQYAGTSRGTVDKVLHNRPGVKESTRDRVLKIIEELDYHPNIIGRALVMNHSPIKLGVIVTPDFNYYIQQVLKGIHAALDEFTPFGITHSIKALTSFDPQEEIALIDELVEENCNGIAVFPIDDPIIIQKVNELYESGITIVTYNSFVDGIKNMCYIGQDNRLAGRTAASLVNRICDPKSDIAVIISSRMLSGHSLRLGGFREKLGENAPGIRLCEIRESFDSDEESYRQTKYLCETYPNIACIYITGGGCTGVCLALKDMHLDRQVRVICHDIPPASISYLEESLIAFSIEQDGYDQGYQLIKVLYNYLFKSEMPKPLIEAPTRIITEELLQKTK